MNKIDEIINLNDNPLNSDNFRVQCKKTLDETGALVMKDFLCADAVDSIKANGAEQQHLAYFTSTTHNIYLTQSDYSFPSDHVYNRQVNSSKGCITTDQIPDQSVLHALYKAQEFKEFLCAVLGEKSLHEYADPLSGINLHYASEGQELGWHYDNSSFAITLLIEKAKAGGVFEYVRDVRDADQGEMNFDQSSKVLDGDIKPKTLSMEPGTLVLFRGRNSMHRVTPTEGDTTRMLVVLAYNTEPNISLSESARMTFFGRLE